MAKSKSKGPTLPKGQSAAALAEEAAERQAKSAADRLNYALIITANHYNITGKGAFEVSIRESLDEPFEQQHMLNALNTVEGVWVQSHSAGSFRWLPVLLEDLNGLDKVSDFVRLVFGHLIPA